MADLRKLILGPALCAAGLAISPCLVAQEAPVEHPAVDRPALPQASQDEPTPVEQPSTAHPAPTSRSPRSTDRRVTSRRGGSARNATGARGQRSFVYLGAGLGLLSGLGGGKDFERSNPAITGLLGVELPLSRATGLGFELALDAELAGRADRDSYTAALARVRLGRMLAPSARLWGGLGIGRAGYRTGSLAGAIAVGSTLLIVPRFGLDLSANLNLVAASSDAKLSALGSPDYNGGLVLLIAFKAMFELHPAR